MAPALWIASKEGMLRLGAYLETGLRDARIRRDEARRLIAAGTDPRDARKGGKVAAMAKADAAKLAAAGLPGEGTFEHVAREWLATVHEVKVTAGHAE